MTPVAAQLVTERTPDSDRGRRDDYDSYVDAVNGLMSFDQRLDQQFFDDDAPSIRAAIAEYFSPTEPIFTGSLFERLIDNEHPDRITAADLVSLGALSEQIPAPVSYWLLSEAGQAATTPLLAEVPTTIDIWDNDAAPHLERDGALWELWNVLHGACWPEMRAANNMGTTRISKLIAAKRPRLVPIQDSIITAVLKPTNLWESMRSALQDEERRRRMQRLTDGAPDGVSLLRRIDAVLWFRNRQLLKRA